MWLPLFLVFSLTLFIYHGTEGRNLDRSLVTLQTSDGDTFDCIDISKQPAFNNPLLKDHKIQIKPTIIPKGSNDFVTGIDAPQNSTHVQFELERSGGCPMGTVPIRRTNKEEKADRISNETSSFHPDTPYDFNNHVAGCVTHKGEKGTFFGGKANINVWNPQVSDNQASFMRILIESWDGDDYRTNTNIIQVGWTVDPSIYGDTKTRLFTSWTADKYIKTGCVDLKCPGFIQTNSFITLGSTVWPISTYNGAQYYITLNVFKDRATSNWWLTYGPNNDYIGYWPKELFTTLANNANLVAYSANNYKNALVDNWPQMGSGHKAREGYGRAAYIRGIAFVNSAYEYELAYSNSVDLVYDVYKCYPVATMSTSDDYGIYAGGPSTRRCQV